MDTYITLDDNKQELSSLLTLPFFLIYLVTI